MKMKGPLNNADMPAAPVFDATGAPIDAFSLSNSHGRNLLGSGMSIGMTKREMMSMHILAGIQANCTIESSEHNAAALAVAYADALLAALEDESLRN